jgi:hypothetical protein
LDIFFPPPGDKDVISHLERFSSIDAKIAPRSTRIATGLSVRLVPASMIFSRMRG